jgi:hypothetical protein
MALKGFSLVCTLVAEFPRTHLYLCADFAPKDGYCLTVAEPDQFYELYGQSE